MAVYLIDRKFDWTFTKLNLGTPYTFTLVATTPYGTKFQSQDHSMQIGKHVTSSST